LDYLQQLSKQVSPDSWKIINEYGVKLAAQKGDPGAQELMDVSSAISDEFQAMIGGGSNAKLELGMHLFDLAKKPESVARVVNFMKQNLQNRADALLGKPPTGPIKSLPANPTDSTSLQIKQDYQSGKISKDAANEALGKIHGKIR
jgi:hypothetical protein